MLLNLSQVLRLPLGLLTHTHNARLVLPEVSLRFRVKAILRSLVAGRSFARMPFLCQPHAKERMFLHGMLDTKGVTRMGQGVACMDLPGDWAQFLYTCAERGLEDSAIILIATWCREGPATVDVTE